MNLDSEIILQTYDLAEMINSSKEVAEYLKYKKLLDNESEVLKLRRQLQKDKELYEETKRFGKFHPDYNQAQQRIDKTLEEINANQIIKKYKKAEEEVNRLLYEISKGLSESVSQSIIVQGNDDLLSEAICSTGTCSSCGLKGSCAI